MAALVLPSLACGPFFPNSFLLGGDAAVLQAPQVYFQRELDRLQLPAPPRMTHVARPPEKSEREFTLDTEILDLRQSLGSRGMDTGALARVVLEFSHVRANLEEHRRDIEAWDADAPGRPRRGKFEEAEPAQERPQARMPRPEMEAWQAPGSLPKEFELYLRGAAAWADQKTNQARAAWTELLSLPADQRRFKSTWANYMLGRSWHDVDPAKAAGFYDQTRKTARSGLADSLGLAVSSLGWEAQLRLRTNDLTGALRLYLDQYASGETNSSAISLGTTAERVLAGPEAQRIAAARDPVFRRVVTAWAMADHAWSRSWEEPSKDALERAKDWLSAIEASGAGEVPLAEQLAVLAYQVGDWETARHWIDLSADSVVAAWIRAKLLLRDGQIAAAAAEYSRVVARLPLQPEVLPKGTPAELADSLFVSDDEFADTTARRQVLGEFGALRLSRGEFVQSLDALLRGGFWQDAAYVAERVLKLEELRRYVDTQWPEVPKVERRNPPSAEGGRDSANDDASGVDDLSSWGGTIDAASQRRAIRHLLARRLMRSDRAREAAPYFPPAIREEHGRLVALLSAGQESTGTVLDRARAKFAAACLVRTNGLELLGTELAPDYAIWGGSYETGPDSDTRLGETNRLVRATPAERKRVEEPPADPNLRFHYRYHAASLAWDAARLMPNNDPETAMVLYRAGCWLKARDPKGADVFYKALVRRCRKTALGDAADRQRWFPELDDQGRPMVTRNSPSPEPSAQ